MDEIVLPCHRYPKLYKETTMEQTYTGVSQQPATRSGGLDKTIMNLILKIVQSFGYIVGPTLVALNLFSFIPGRRGYFYTTAAEWGIAVGVFLIMLAVVSKYWRK
jgi:hypothetical protein